LGDDFSLGLDAEQGRFMLLSELAFYASPEVSLRKSLRRSTVMVANYSTDWILAETLLSIPKIGWNAFFFRPPILAQRVRFVSPEEIIIPVEEIDNSTNASYTKRPPWRGIPANCTNWSNMTFNISPWMNWTVIPNVANASPLYFESTDFEYPIWCIEPNISAVEFDMLETEEPEADPRTWAPNYTNATPNITNFSNLSYNITELLSTEYISSSSSTSYVDLGNATVPPPPPPQGPLMELSLKGYVLPAVPASGDCGIEVSIRDSRQFSTSAAQATTIELASGAYRAINGTVRLSDGTVEVPPGGSLELRLFIPDNMTSRLSFGLEADPSAFGLTSATLAFYHEGQKIDSLEFTYPFLENQTYWPAGIFEWSTPVLQNLAETPTGVINVILSGVWAGSNHDHHGSPVKPLRARSLNMTTDSSAKFILPSAPVIDWDGVGGRRAGQYFPAPESPANETPKEEGVSTNRILFQHTLELTPVVKTVTPDRVEGRGSMEVLLRGERLKCPRAIQMEDVSVTLAGLPCKVIQTEGENVRRYLPTHLNYVEVLTLQSGGLYLAKNEIGASTPGIYYRSSQSLDDHDPAFAIMKNYLPWGHTIRAISWSEGWIEVAVAQDTILCKPADYTLARLSGQSTVVEDSVVVHVPGCGTAVHSADLLFLYVELWSQPLTWPAGEPPLEGESVEIEFGRTIVVDFTAPKLRDVLVRGRLAFDEGRPLLSLPTLQAERVYVHGGSLEVGRVKVPRAYDALLALGSANSSTTGQNLAGQLPSVSIIVADVARPAPGDDFVPPIHSPWPESKGELHMHGEVPGLKTSILREAAMSGATTVVLESSLDAHPGDKIVIGPNMGGLVSGYGEPEEFTVTSVNPDGRLTLDKPLGLQHGGDVLTYTSAYRFGNKWIYFFEYNTQHIDRRASVNVLGRHVHVRGEPNGTGVQVSCARSTGNCRFEGTEITHCGRATSFMPGIPCLHLRALPEGYDGSLAYVLNSSIHDTIGPGITIDAFDDALGSGSGNVSVAGNLLYKTSGGGLRIAGKRGVEGVITVSNNTVISPQSQLVGLSDALRPVAYKIEGRGSVWYNNRAEGAAAGFRYDPRAEVVPPLGKHGEFVFHFDGNTAHDCRDVSLFVAGEHRSGQETIFSNFTAVQSGRAIHVLACDSCRFIDVQWMFCHAGAEDEESRPAPFDPPQYQRVVAIGSPQSSPQALISVTTLPQLRLSGSQNWHVENMSFVNFGWNPVIHGGYRPVTIKVTGLLFDRAYTRLLTSEPAGWGIFFDLDGRLSGHTEGYAMGDKGFNRHEECEAQGSTNYNDASLFCSPEVKVRMLQIGHPTPENAYGGDVQISSKYGTGTLPHNYRYGDSGWWEFPVIGGVQWLGFQNPSTYWNEGGPLPHEWRTTVHFYTFEVLDRAHPWTSMKVRYGDLEPLLPEEWIGVHFVYRTMPPISRVEVKELGGACNGSIPKGYFEKPRPEQGCGAYSMLYEFCANSSKPDCSPNGSFQRYTNEINADNFAPYFASGTISVMVAPPVPQLNSTAATMTVEALPCPSWGCRPKPRVVTTMGPETPWDDILTWPDLNVPEEFEDVTIKTYYNIAIDFKTPPLGNIIVQEGARLALSPTGERDATLLCRSIMVHGIFEIGSKEDPWPRHLVAKVLLWGNRTQWLRNPGERHIGTKVLHASSTATINIHGVPEQRAWARLTKNVVGADEYITLDTEEEVIWNVTDNVEMDVAITPTEYQGDLAGLKPEIVKATIKYKPDLETAMLTLTEEVLRYQHFVGSRDGLPAEANAMVQAAAALMERNVIFGTYEYDPEAELELVRLGAPGQTLAEITNATIYGGVHGAHIVVDAQANFSMTWTKLWHCGQDTPYPSYLDEPRFACLRHISDKGVPALNKARELRGNLFMHSHGGGAVQLVDSPGWTIEENVFHNTTGPAIDATNYSFGLRLRRNLAMENRFQWRLPHQRNKYIPVAAFRLDILPDELTNNLVAGGQDIGFQFRPPPCGDELSVLRLGHGFNVSNEAVGCVVGFFILRACNERGGGPGVCSTEFKCVEIRNIKAWKNSHVGILFVDQPSSLNMSQVYVQDNHIGITGSFHRMIGDQELFFILQHGYIFGSTEASTCFAGVGCRAVGPETIPIAGMGPPIKECNSVVGPFTRRVGLMLPIITNRGKTCEDGPIMHRDHCETPNMPETTCALPWEQRYGTQGSRFANFTLLNLWLSGFNREDCGQHGRAIVYNPTGRDFSPLVNFGGVNWLDMIFVKAEPGQDCPFGFGPIMSRARCFDAFKVLGGIDDISNPVMYPRRPQGCYLHLTNNKCHFNAAENWEFNNNDQRYCELGVGEGTTMPNMSDVFESQAVAQILIQPWAGHGHDQSCAEIEGEMIGTIVPDKVVPCSARAAVAYRDLDGTLAGGGYLIAPKAGLLPNMR
jgi:hypothetical protein